MVVVDIDDLKPINDTVGHTAGDSVIRAVAGSIRSIIRAGDLVFRWGGDLILLFGISEHDARVRIEGLNHKPAMFLIPGATDPMKISVSFGIAAFDKVAGIEAAIDSADAEMYASKQTHKHAGNLDRANSFQF